MPLNLIAAVGWELELGTPAGLPWRLPDDLKRFRALTWGHPIIMGRKTFETLGRPLPGRLNVVLTRSGRDFGASVRRVTTPDEALEVARSAGTGEAFVIGGAEVYRLFLPRVERVFLTCVCGRFADADTFFPDEFPAGWSWMCKHYQAYPADERNSHPAFGVEMCRAPAPDEPPMSLYEFVNGTGSSAQAR